VNQAALRWLKEAKAAPNEDRSYLAQLAWWGLENGIVRISCPIAPTQPTHDEVETAIGSLLGSGPGEAEFASRWFLSNPNLDEEEQAGNLELMLSEAENAEEAAHLAVETAYDRIVASSPTYPGYGEE
jgi:hypothetical protein